MAAMAFWGLFCPQDFTCLNPNPSPTVSSNPGTDTVCGQTTSPLFVLSGNTQQLFCFAAEWSNVSPATVYRFADFGGSTVTEFPPSAPASVSPLSATKHLGLSAVGLCSCSLGPCWSRNWAKWNELFGEKERERKRKQDPSYFTGCFVMVFNSHQFLIWFAGESHEEVFEHNWKRAVLEQNDGKKVRDENTSR